MVVDNVSTCFWKTIRDQICSKLNPSNLSVDIQRNISPYCCGECQYNVIGVSVFPGYTAKVISPEQSFTLICMSSKLDGQILS